MFKYQLYGLNISSSREIDILRECDFLHSDLIVKWNVSSEETPDNKFEWKEISTALLDKLNEISLSETETENGALTKVCFNLEDGRPLNFVLDEERKNISIFHQKSEPKSDLESYFVGPVMSFVLRLRGVLCLHSSVVAIGDKAIAFTGPATAGKSTLAAGMANAGAKILADDIAVLVPENGVFYVQPGYEKVRLRPVAAEFLTAAPEQLPMVYSYRASRYYSLENGKNFGENSLPLAAIYVLGEVSDAYKSPSVKPLETREKLVNLVKNTSGSYVVTGNLRTREFQALAQIANTVPIRRLFYAHDIETLPTQCELIIKDFQTIGATLV